MLGRVSAPPRGTTAVVTGDMCSAAAPHNSSVIRAEGESQISARGLGVKLVLVFHLPKVPCVAKKCFFSLPQ